MSARKVSDSGARERILRAAASIFARKGFDGARVDEIAAAAGVNKALICYYFKSKEELLSLLFTETRDAVFALIREVDMANVDFTSHRETEDMVIRFLELLESRQDVIRVVIMELAKRTPTNNLIFSLLEEIFRKMFSVAEKMHLTLNPDLQQSMVTEFFTGILPMLDYVAYHEIWMERFGIDEATLRHQFIHSFLGTHFAFTVGTPPHGED